MNSAPLPPAPEPTPLHGLQRLAGLGGPLLGEGTIVEIFPESRVALQIDLDGGCATGVIDERPNAEG